MIISMIAALAENNVIGIKNKLPWKLPADLRFFREKTLNKTIVMGQKTFESIGSRALPKRRNIILSNDPNFKVPENCILAKSIDEVLELSKNEKELMVCGGSSVYSQFLPLTNRLYLTFIHHSFEGDAFFPKFNINEWRETSRINNQPDQENLYSYSFIVLEKKVSY